jgi:hypothetical protein
MSRLESISLFISLSSTSRIFGILSSPTNPAPGRIVVRQPISTAETKEEERGARLS